MSSSRHNLIPEIQGIRAVAVLAVLVYHVWPQVLPGGYVGVDVFFVISGYLITGSLFREFEATGSIDIAGFYARRIRRLLPAATLVSLTVALCLPIFPRIQWADIGQSLVASALYVQNWSLAVQAVDYLADDAKGPMNHFWSLSVEEQYYIIWPLLLLPILSQARKKFTGARTAFGWLIGLIGIASLTYSIVLTPQDPGVSYFATTTRAWELALGGGLAVFEARLKPSQPMRAGLGVVGLLAVLAACLGYSDATSFPGYAALLPALGAAAMILSRGAPMPWSAASLLNTRLFQYFGDISYSLYLWHWPLIVVYGEMRGADIDYRSGLLLLSTSLALAHLSKIFIEDPFRSKGSSVATGRTLAASAMGIVVVVAVGLGFLTRGSDNSDLIANTQQRGGLAMMDAEYDWRREDLTQVVPRPEKARKDVPSAYAKKCHQEQRRTEVLSCDYGDPNSKIKIVMLGDSHATHWFPAFEKIATTRSVYFRGVAKSACLFSLEPVYNATLKRPYTECAEWSHNVIAWIARERPDVVLISQSPGYPMAAVKGMTEAWTKLIEMNLPVRAVLTTPWMPFEPSKCAEESPNWTVDCVPVRSTVFRPDLTRAAAEALKVPTWDFSDYFCLPQHCPIVAGGVFVYRDRHHMTATFAKSLVEPIENNLAQISGFKLTFAQRNN